jgi:uncharacterized protein YnzC (UPF0291/DUF896 family)
MRLDFNILWVEDQPHAVKAQLDRIAYLIRKEGFRLQTEFAGGVEEAKGFLSADIFGDHIDLILMDYDLGATPSGDEGLTAVRNVFPYKDIVFYSARAPDLLDLVARKRVQGVFCSTRDELPDTVMGLFESLVKKVLDIDHSRGIVMGATSDIDHLINDTLQLIFDGGDQEIHARTLEIIAQRMKEIRERFNRAADAIETITSLPELFNHHNVYSSIDRLNLLRKLLTTLGLHKDKCEAMKLYANDTVPKRNLLAHVQVKREGFSRKLVDRKGNELTSEQMKELRHALLSHQEAFEELLTLMKRDNR